MPTDLRLPPEEELVAFRRDLHAHPELAWQERRTTERIAARLEAAGIAVRRTEPTGLIAEVGGGPGGVGPVVVLRADIDALPLEDRGGDPWASTVPGVAHACGHDVHTTALLGAALALAELDAREPLPGRVRLLFQPAEEVMPGGALRLMEQGALEGVVRAYALHCDPTVDVGQVGLRVGPLTGAADALEVRLRGHGGHTSRPHLTQDLTFALGHLVTGLPGALSRRLDPRAGATLVWGLVQAGATHNVIPTEGRAAGTIRILDAGAWAEAERLVRELVPAVVAPYGVEAEVLYTRGVPPVVNHPEAVGVLADAVRDQLGPDGVVTTLQSLGGEDFGWYLDRVPGAMARLGTRTPDGRTYDLHQGDLRIDERAIGIGARLLADTAVQTLAIESVTKAPPSTGAPLSRP
ncbi:amidohydrolase [uncultured Nocardioides sp.]|uniref:amidohydrolase n=1 Tax=uncultured Nocardioides sp. TaxID=198441 RepID=UPI00262484DC|nr:amidohydrolase [uncultured Nocardioides sp.]